MYVVKLFKSTLDIRYFTVSRRSNYHYERYITVSRRSNYNYERYITVSRRSKL